MPVPPSLAESYLHCGRIVRRASTNFYWSFRLLPQAKRQAMAALYAFARRTDDLGDGDEPLAERERALGEWRLSLSEGLAKNPHGAILPAVVDAVQRFHIPPRYLFEIVDGVAMDLHHQGFETFDELRHYCYHVASAVGLACLHIWGFHDEHAVREPAIECGVAFQLTNILRDLKEDSDRARMYLPRDEMRRFHYTEDDLRNAVCDERFSTLMRFQIERAEQCYRAAAATSQFLHADGRRMFNMMFNTYRGLLKKIQRDPNVVLQRRVQLSFAQKLKIAAVSCCRGIT